MSWHGVDGAGRALGTGRPPAGPGHSSPAAALAAAPVVTWPLAAAADDGHRLRLGAALGAGGDRVEHLLGALAGGRLRVSEADVAALARATPAGTVELPLAVVASAAAVEATAEVEPAWLAEVDRERSAARRALLEAGRSVELEAALHVAVLVATDELDPADDTDVDSHVASGARLWLLTGAVVSALAGLEPDAFAPWGWLVAAGFWPVGPTGGRLVVGTGGDPPSAGSAT